MTIRQKYTLTAALLGIAVLTLIPPYFGIDTASNGQVHAFIGYHPIWNPPSPEYVYNALNAGGTDESGPDSLSSYEARVNVVRLGLSIVVLMIVAAFAFVMFRGRSGLAR